MSAEAVGWVFSDSPYDGTMFALHLALADIVNDTYGNEVWASTTTLATKARVSTRSVRRGLQQMVKDGTLVLVAAEEGKPRRYRFVMAVQEALDLPDPGHSVTPDTTSPLTLVHPTPAKVSPPPRTPRPRTPDTVSPKHNQLNTELKEPNSFAHFWSVYPRRVGKGAAVKAWDKAVKKTDPATIIAGATAYRDDPTRDPRYTAHPTTWLNAERWDDDHAVTAAPVEPKGMTGLRQAAQRRGLL